MPKDKGIVEQAADTIIDVKDAAKEKVQTATETIKKVLVGNSEEKDAAKKTMKEKTGEIKNAAEETYEEAMNTGRKAEDIAKEKFEKAREHAEQTAENAKEKLKLPHKDEELKPEKEKENFEKNKFYAFEKVPAIAAQRITTIFDSVFEPRFVPVVCTNLKRFVK